MVESGNSHLLNAIQFLQIHNNSGPLGGFMDPSNDSNGDLY